MSNKYFNQNEQNISRYAYEDELNQSVSVYSSPTFTNIHTQYVSAANDLTVNTGTDKTLVLNETVYNDINVDPAPRNVGVGRPTLATFKGNLQQFQFAINDFSDFRAIELLHGWKEGSEIELHLHWAQATNNDATVRGVKWEVEYSYADMGGIFVANDSQSKETSISANEPAYTHKYTSIFSFTPATKIGTQVCMKLKRIASVDNVAPATDPFVLSFGLHYQIDTIGSRQRGSK